MKRSSLLLFLLLPSFLLAQEEDFQLWSAVELNYKLNKKVALSFDEGFRMRENASLPAKAFSNLSVSYKQNKHWRFGAAYRFIQSFDLAQEVFYRHRFYADVSWRNKHKRWSYSYRARFQQQYGINHFERYHRSKLSCAYNIRKTPLEPFVAAELFLPIAFEGSTDKMRYTAGLGYPLAKKLDASVYYRLQKDVGQNDPLSQYIVGLGLSYSL
jgi:hypothetical protein